MDKLLFLVWSFILDYENNSNPDNNVKEEIATWRKKADFIVKKSDVIIAKAKELHAAGFGKKDSLHLASAIASDVEYFITVDKGIIKRKGKVAEIMYICNPVEFIGIIEELHNEK